MARFFILILSLVLFTSHRLTAQGEIDEENNIVFKHERVYGLSLNSNGFAVGFRYAKNINASLKTLYDVEMAFVKHQKEAKQQSSNSGRIYTYGKMNSVYNFRAGLGLQKELYSKRDKGGVSIRYFYNGGLSASVLKPIYYLIVESGSLKAVKFPENEHLNGPDIEGKAEFYKGLNELSVIPGIYGKLGFTFEFGTSEKIFQALESGAIIDLFPKKIPIMASEENSFYFLTLFIAYRFGNIIDAKYKSNINKVDKLLIEQ